MPVPIQKIVDSVDKESGNDNYTIDYSFLLNNMPKPKNRIVTASDKDADLLIRLWSTADTISEDVYKIASSEFTQDDILRLKAHGFLTGSTEEVKLTNKAKAVITTMALGENNAFTKMQKKKSYTEIIASMDKRGKKGFRMAKVYDGKENLINLNSESE